MTPVFFNSTLINGKGRYLDPFGKDLTSELAVVNVKKGTRYRMRLISMSCDPVRDIGFEALETTSDHNPLELYLQHRQASDDHHRRLTTRSVPACTMLTPRRAVEGTNVQPLVVDQIQIFAGQRYSFVLNANQPVDNYCWSHCFLASRVLGLTCHRDTCFP